MRTLKYSITKILIYTISAMLIYFLKTQVFAMTCDTDYSRPFDSQFPTSSFTASMTDYNNQDKIIFLYSGTDYVNLNVPEGYDYAIIKVPLTWSLNNQSNAINTPIDVTMSPPVFYMFENTVTYPNDAWRYGYYDNGYFKVRMDVRDVGRNIHVRGLGVRFPKFYNNFGRTSFYANIERYWFVEFYKCDSNSNIENKIDETNNKLQETKDYLEDDNTSTANNSASGFFNNFNNTDHGGLSGIVSAPMRLINALSSSSCSPLTFPLPFVNEQVTLPCMSPIYSQNFGAFLTLYRLITTGLIGYWVCIKLYGKVRAIKKPEDDRIEVLEL